MRMVRKWLALSPGLVLAIVVAQPSFLAAQSSAYEGKDIVNIQFVPAEQPVDAAELFEILPLKRGQPLHQSDLRNAIARLFATGRYADIQVDAEPYQNGVIIRFITQNSWFIGNVHAAGNVSNPPNSGQLENAADLDLGQPYTAAKLRQAVANQRRLLESDGLYRAIVKPNVYYDSQYQQAKVRFDVDSGPRANLTMPVLQGDLKLDAEKIIEATRWRRWMVHSWKPMTQERVREGVDRIRKLYDREDRLEAKIALERVDYDPENRLATPTLRVDAGPRISVNAIGARLSHKTLRQYVPIYEEHAVDHDLLVEGARNLRDYYQRGGYFDSQVEFKEQRVANDRASIDFLVNMGVRHKLVLIEIKGNHYFGTATIRERMYLQTASFLQYRRGRYSESYLNQDEQSILGLYQSNGFRDAKVSHLIIDDYKGVVANIAVFLNIEEGPQYF